MITIVTPTYNRAHTLVNCYNSLVSQSSNQFIWMIIDDGSTDNTESLVRSWISEGKIKIKYYKKENGGKASALNMSIDLLDTPYTACLDSDDYFTNNAIKDALSILEKINKDNTICGVLALRSHADGSVLGGREIPPKYKAVKAEALLLVENLRTEYICFYKTEILKKYRFPEFEGEKFIPPSWMMFTITREYRYVVSHKRFCICEYCDDGITRNKNNVIVKNPKGYTCAKLWYYNLSNNLRLTIKHGIMYDCGCIISKESKWLSNTNRKVLAVLLRPIAYVLYIKRFKMNK